MYREHFGLTALPFSIAPDPRYLFLSEQHREALAHLLYGIQSEGGFVLLTGEVGTGKTTVCRCLLEKIPENTDIAFILNPKVTSQELLSTICDELGISYPDENTSVKVFVDKINMYLLDAFSKGRKTVLIIEEAQNLSSDVLEQIRLLTNLETNQQKLLQIVMVGQPELKDILSRQELQQLAQRVTARYHLGPLSKKEVGAYVNHRLSVAGAHTKLFPDSVMKKLYNLSRGIPRLINVICDRTLLGAYVQGKVQVDKQTLVEAAREVFGKTDSQDKKKRILKWVFAGIFLVSFSSVLVMAYYNQKTQFSSIIPSTHEKKDSNNKIKRLDTLNRPANLSIDQSRDSAYAILFDLWGIPYQTQKTSSPCKQAEAKGLQCLNSRGSLNELINLNRPAMLKLFDEKGHGFYATLTGIHDTIATVAIGEKLQTVDIKDVEKMWLGEYTLFWRMPREIKRSIYPGYRGHEVKWLEKQLSIIQGRVSQHQETSYYDNALVTHIKKFQLAEGLLPDGIVGPHTLIHINNATGSKEPGLARKKKDN